MGIPAQRDRAFPQLVLPQQALGVLAQLGQHSSCSASSLPVTNAAASASAPTGPSSAGLVVHREILPNFDGMVYLDGCGDRAGRIVAIWTATPPGSGSTSSAG